MKFSHSLQFNSVPEWRDAYLDYDHLKKTIYALEKDLYDGLAHAQARAALVPAFRDEPDHVTTDIEHESAALLARDGAGGSTATATAAPSDDTDRTFVHLLDAELRKICAFYLSQERRLVLDVERIQDDIQLAEQEDLHPGSASDDDSDDDEADIGHGTAEHGPPVGADADADADAGLDLEAAHESGISATTRPVPAYASRRRRRRSSAGSSSTATPAGGPSSSSAAAGPAATAARAHGRYLPQAQAQDPETGSRPGLWRSRTESLNGGAAAAGSAANNGSARKRTTSNGSWSLSRVAALVPRRSRSAARTDASGPSATSSSYSHSHSHSHSHHGGRVLGSIWDSDDDYAIDMRITFKRRLTDLFVSLSELQQFVQLNRLGMKKILKKYDKILSRSLQAPYLQDVVDKQYPFTEPARRALQTRVRAVVGLYARVHVLPNEEMALSQLRAHLREEVVWQRNTVWREMIGIERKAQGAQLGRDVLGFTRGGDLHLGSSPKEDSGKPAREGLRVPVLGWRMRLPLWFGAGTIQLLFALVVFIAVLRFPALRIFERVEEQNCLAILALCTVLWATEVIPLFVTSFLVPLLVVTLRVARSDDGHDRRLGANETAKWIFLQMFAPNMCLLLGGFTLAAALSKYGIDKVMAVKVLRLAGTRPSTVLLAHMAVATFASMWVSNVAAPVLMFSLVQPILRTLPPGSPYARALILGIALASNIGGQTSPIASPQNLIALQYMADAPVGWLQWFAIALPVSGLSVLLVWLLLLRIYGSGRGVVIRKVTPPSEHFSGLQWCIVAVCVGTILLWCLESRLEYLVGDMGVVALLPIIIFFGTGLLSKEDFNNFLWTVLFLAMGGIALGKAVTASGLLDSLDELIQQVVAHMSLGAVLLSLLAISLAVATFISHTIAAVLLVPIAAQVGESLDVPHPRLLIMATTLAASAAMGLPVSGFPNMTAASLEDSMGERYLTVRDFLKAGVVATLLCGVVIASVGVVIMVTLGL